jgi:hypothetical protein
MTQNLTQHQALALIETYGADAHSWPSHCAQALQDACDHDPIVRAAQAREAGLDEKLQQIFTPAPDALKDRIITQMLASPSAEQETIFATIGRAQLSAGLSALVACLLIGFFGAGLIEQQDFFDTDAEIALAHSSLELWTAID